MPRLHLTTIKDCVRAACALVIILFAPSSAHATCASPSGNTGDLIFSTSINAMVYCNGTNWISMGAANAASFGTLTSTDFCAATSGTAIACTTAFTGAGSVVLATSPTLVAPTVSSGGLTITAGGLTVSAGGANITGTVTGTSFSGNGAALTNLNASNISSGTVPTANLGSGGASSSTYLRGDSFWSSPFNPWTSETAVSSNTTVPTTASHTMYEASGTITLTMPTAATAGTGFQIGVVNTGTGTITVSTGSDNVNGTVISNTALTGRNAAVIFISDGTNWLAENLTSSVTFGCPHGGTIYAYTGSTQTFTVPILCTSITIKAWGAGGGSQPCYSSGYCDSGGGGGFAQGSLTVTSGATLTVLVGQGGYYGGGGGYSGVFNGSVSQANALIIGGGGGGGGGGDVGSGTPNGGFGGGTTGGTGSTGQGTPGTGGSQVAGGSTGGAALQGGSSSGSGCGGGYAYGGGGIACGVTNSYWPAGGGGGGYYGGGAGSGAGSLSSTGGGGGSSYIGSATSTTITSGSGTTAANTGDTNYVSGIGTGSITGTTSGVGGNGEVYISW